MKKMILSAVVLTASVICRAQTAAGPDTLRAAAGPIVESAAPESGRSEWLPAFTAVEISAPCDIRFVQVAENEAPRIVYDTRGADTRFRFEVRDKVLRITERPSMRRSGRSAVTLYYNELLSVSVSDAAATFDGVILATLFDLKVGGMASVTAELDVKDLRMDLSGRSTATLTGDARYATLTVSTGTLMAQKLETMSAQISVSNSASAEIWVTDRLEFKTSTNGRLAYKGTPSILRGGTKFLGGDIRHIVE